MHSTPNPNEVRTRSKPAPGLHVVATPIGNLGDITHRALGVLAGADAVVCEDTRVTGSLFKHLGLKPPSLIAYHEHNAARVRPTLLARLERGEALALVSDAGTPLISDPGYRLVQEAVELGHAVFPLPGASALLAALVVAGLPTDRFLFAGFPPTKTKARLAFFQSLALVPATLVFYESPHRLPESLGDLAQVLGPRPAAVCRELTKLYEETRRDTLPRLAAHYSEAGGPKGEVVIVVGPPEEDPEVTAEQAAADLDTLLRQALNTGQSVRDAAATVAAACGEKKKVVYARALALAAEREPGA